MKIKLILLIAAFAIGSGVVHAHNTKTEVPQVVLDAFKQKYPTAADTEWEKDKLNYEVEFTLDSIEYEATFSADGTWLETEREIEVDELPANITEAFKTKFPKAKIVEIEWVETPKSKFYEIEYKKGWKKREAIFDEAGNYLQEIKE